MDASTDGIQSAELATELNDLCQSFDIRLDDDQLLSLIGHLLAVLEVNEHINLTRITDIHEALTLHILDSLLLLKYVDGAPQGALLDMGTGAGFPGLPLAVATRRPTTLLDSVGKKITAVASIVDRLGLCNILTVHDRVESYAAQHLGVYACVTARAVSSLPVLMEYASPLLMHCGLLVVTKGKPSDEEIHAGRDAAKLVGFSQPILHSFELPHNLGHRTIVVAKKVSKPSIRLPRQVGMAKKSPLAYSL